MVEVLAQMQASSPLCPRLPRRSRPFRRSDRARPSRAGSPPPARRVAPPRCARSSRVSGSSSSASISRAPSASDSCAHCAKLGAGSSAVLAADLCVALAVPITSGSDICRSRSAKRASICSISCSSNDFHPDLVLLGGFGGILHCQDGLERGDRDGQLDRSGSRVVSSWSCIPGAIRIRAQRFVRFARTT